MATKKLKQKRLIKKQSKGKRPRVGKILTTTLYTYLQPRCLKYAQKRGKEQKFGSASGFINALVCKDLGVKPPEGLRGTQGKPRPESVAKGKKVAAKKKAVTKKKVKAAPKKKSVKKRVARLAVKLGLTKAKKTVRAKKAVPKKKVGVKRLRPKTDQTAAKVETPATQDSATTEAQAAA